MKYVITYEYNYYPACGSGCCHDSRGDIHIYEYHQWERGIYTSCLEDVGYISNEQELREYIDKNCPEFNDFIVDPDTDYA